MVHISNSLSIKKIRHSVQSWHLPIKVSLIILTGIFLGSWHLLFEIFRVHLKFYRLPGLFT